MIFSRIGYLFSYLLPIILIIGFEKGGVYQYALCILVFILIPLADNFIGENTTNLQKDVPWWYNFMVFSWVPVQFGVLIWACNYSITMEPTLANWTILCLSTALITGGIGITVAHELGHKKDKKAKLSSLALLLSTCYMHFYIEHNKGHHVWVGTLQDAATSRKNENFYQFWFRSITKGFISAWNIETQRLSRLGKPTVSPHNQMIWFTALPLLLGFALPFLFQWYTGIWHWQVTACFFGQAFLAFSLLELVNYVEHYGLLRKLHNNRPERVDIHHSWNSSFLLSNFLLFHLQRHSDHHVAAIKPYQNLVHHQESPQLPAGYPTMVLLALIPSLWFKIMNARLEKWELSR